MSFLSFLSPSWGPYPQISLIGNPLIHISIVSASASSSPSLIHDGFSVLSTPIAIPPPLTPFEAFSVLFSSYHVYFLLLGIFILPDLPVLVSCRNIAPGFSLFRTFSKDSNLAIMPFALLPRSKRFVSFFLFCLLFLFLLLLFSSFSLPRSWSRNWAPPSRGTPPCSGCWGSSGLPAPPAPPAPAPPAVGSQGVAG